MSYDMMCGGAACLNDTDCAMEGLICCELQNLCGSKRCVLSVEDSGMDSHKRDYYMASYHLQYQP